MHTLGSEDLREVLQLARALRHGDGLTASRMAELVAAWEPKALPDAKDRCEQFVIARPDGSMTGVVGPRWVFHLLGLRHRAAEIGLRTPSGLIVLQRRSETKEDWPGAPDMAVAGHVPQRPDGGDLSFEEGAWKELEEELGLDRAAAAQVLAEGRLIAIGAPYVSCDADPRRNPPFFNSEVRQIFGATITGEGLARIRFVDGEAVAAVLVTEETAWEMLAGGEVASGMRYSLPRYLDWIAQTQAEPPQA